MVDNRWAVAEEVEARWEFHYGKEHAPTSPYGGNTLVVFKKGIVTLEHRRFGAIEGQWTAIAPDAFDRIAHHLREGGFPGFEARPFPPGTSVNRLALLGGEVGSPIEIDIDYFHALELPGYREAWQLLVSVLWQASNGRFKVGGEQAEVTVIDVKKVGELIDE